MTNAMPEWEEWAREHFLMKKYQKKFDLPKGDSQVRKDDL